MENFALVSRINEQVIFEFVLKNRNLNKEKKFKLQRNAAEAGDKFWQRLTKNVSQACSKWEPNSTLPEIKFLTSEGETVLFKDNDESLHQLLLKTGLTFLVNDQRFSIVINPPMVESIQMRNNIWINYVTFPYKLTLTLANEDDSCFEWFKCCGDSNVCDKGNSNWMKVGEGFLFYPPKECLGHHLKIKCIPRRGNVIGFEKSVISSNPVSMGPTYCPFEKRHKVTANDTQRDHFRMLTYNILGDMYVEKPEYRLHHVPYCPIYALAFEYRNNILIKEVLGYNCDVMAFQEVDQKLFDHVLVPVFGHCGYEGNFYIKGGVAGLAVFWRRSKFEVLFTRRISLKSVVESEAEFSDLKEMIKSNEYVYQRFMNTVTILQTVALKSLEDEDKCILIGNTHLYSYPNADNVRLLQSALSLRIMKQQQDQLLKNHSKCAILYCGDFNSDLRGVPKFVTTGFVDVENPCWSNFPGEEIKNVSLSHPFQMQSACGWPKFTFYTTQYISTLDFIFYQSDVIELESSVPLPDVEDVESYLPSPVWPSDHLACIAELKFR